MANNDLFITNLYLLTMKENLENLMHQQRQDQSLKESFKLLKNSLALNQRMKHLLQHEIGSQ